MERAFDDAALDVEIALAQRCLGMAAGVIQRVERSGNIENRNRDAIDLHARGATRRDVD
jgi:hypothetical protein